MSWKVIVIIIFLLLSPKVTNALLNFLLVFVLTYLFFPEFLTGVLSRLQ